MPIRISGVLKNGLGKPIPNCTIELKSKKTTLSVIATTEADQLVDVIGSYVMDVEPGQYSVSLCITGFPRKPVGDIQVYSDSRPGTLNDFLMMPDESDLTPELVLIFQQLRDEARQAANEAKADKKLADNILTDLSTVQTDVNEKQQLVNADMIEAGKSKTAAAASAKAASEDARKTTGDVATVAGLKANAETAAQQAEISNVSASGHAGRAEAAADSVKTLTASAGTLAPDSNATAQWDRETNNLSIGIPKGVKGDKGDKGEQGIQGIQGLQGIQGVKGDKGDTGPQAQLSPLLTAISALDTAANQLIYLTGKDATATTALTQLGRKLIAASGADDIRSILSVAYDPEVLKINNALSEISTADAKTAARGNLGLGNVATKSTGVDIGDILSVGDFGLGSLCIRIPEGGNWNDVNKTGFYVGYNITNTPTGNWVFVIHLEHGGSGGYAKQIAYALSNGHCWYRQLYGGAWSAWVTNWSTQNTTVDSNGFIKRASPVVKLFRNGSSELNRESADVTTERLSEGVYRLSGSLMGFNSDGLWDIEIPNDDNKQPLIWANSTVEANGDIIVKTYHRTHPNAPKFAQNNILGYVDGDPIDIPTSRWLDLRVQVYNDEQSHNISEEYGSNK